jgi:hypothetical protein
MSNDLDTPAALSAIDAWATATLTGVEVESTSDVSRAIDAIFGIV